ncbi:MAG: BatA domain-containing protein [Planctomycetaceae bacterium]|nr:BatA domain-containing protein [Planctomycetaceae bacterium]
MSFLAPFYLLAGLAIAGPVIFHLIRRTPRGRQVFGSLMFLKPSPPRLTKRSRIEDWLVLILRGLALLLLALAFARPFFREKSSQLVDPNKGRRVVILLDTSASMRRGELWTNAVAAVESVASDLGATDGLTCIMFDSSQRVLMSEEEWEAIPTGSRAQQLTGLLGQTTPTWSETRLADALMVAAEQLNSEAESVPASREIVLISDLQSGTDWDAIRGYNWPGDVRLKLIPVAEGTETNIGLQVVSDADRQDGETRVRLSSSAEASEELFLLGWIDRFAESTDSPEASIPVTIPAGESRVVRAPALPEGYSGQELVLTGDDCEFDNRCFVARRSPWDATVVWIGSKEQNPGSLRFFLSPLFPETSRRTVSIVDAEGQDVASLPDKVSLIICGGAVDAETLAWTKSKLKAGTNVLYVADSPEQSQGVFSLIDQTESEVVAENSDDYFMVGKVDFDHALMAPFNDPRFSDFTKLRFWKRRRFTSLDWTAANIIWAFDDGTPALAEWKVDDGSLFLLTSTWKREDSELALWSKFPPLMNELLDKGRPPLSERVQFVVGENIVPANIFEGTEGKVFLQSGSTDPKEISVSESLEFDQPGLIRLARTREELQDTPVELAVNIAAEESNLSPLDADQFTSLGIPLESNDSSAEVELDAGTMRQLMNAELESKQQWWRWILVIVLGLLFAETILSSFRKSEQVVEAA